MQVPGAFYPLDWMWDGEVKSFMYDGSWSFQHLTSDGFPFWNSCGRDCGGSKTEHNSPDPYGGSRFMQSSTAGWYGSPQRPIVSATHEPAPATVLTSLPCRYGFYDFTGVTALLEAAAGGFPTKVPATFTLLQGEQDITAQASHGPRRSRVTLITLRCPALAPLAESPVAAPPASPQIMLGGKGKKANGEDQTTMSDKYSVAEDGTVSDSAKVLPHLTCALHAVALRFPPHFLDRLLADTAARLCSSR